MPRFLSVLVLIVSLAAAPSVTARVQGKIVSLSAAELNTARQLGLHIKGEVDLIETHIAILGPDGHRVAQLEIPQQRASRQFEVEWKGLDASGKPVPDEVFYPILETQSGDIIFDPRRESGGEIITPLPWHFGKHAELVYELPAPARVLIRGGIKDGPLMATLENWAPHTAGKVVKRWNGFDADDVVNISEREDFWLVLMAYQLPKLSIITSGNRQETYRAYKTRYLAGKPVIPVPQQTRRNDIRLEMDFYRPRTFLPEISLTWPDTTKASNRPVPLPYPEIDKPTLITVDASPEDLMLLQGSIFEAVFFVDGQFISEEELGFLPMQWRVETEKLTKGSHFLTVQLFAYDGILVSRTTGFYKK